MIKKICLLLLLFNINAYAQDLRSLQCGYLHINIINQSGYTCKLSYHRQDYGTIASGTIPQSIANGEKAQPIVVQQSYTHGPNLRLEYDCANKKEDNLVILTSQQNLCVLTAGNINADTINTNEVYATFDSTMGSWWSAKPGEVTWILHG